MGTCDSLVFAEEKYSEKTKYFSKIQIVESYSASTTTAEGSFKTGVLNTFEFETPDLRDQIVPKQVNF